MAVSNVAESESNYRLTKRETEVLQCLAEGMSNAEIAETLGVAHATVKVHTNRIYQKMNVKNRTQAAIKAQYIGIGPLAQR